ncbi:MAG: pyridoxamine 5'-phosphate oxidase family protein [Pseudomonadota bacterium]
MTQMSQDEKMAFLADLHVGVLGLNDPGRGPLTVPIWYDYTPGGELWMVTGANSRKGKLLEAGTRVSLAAQTEQAPYRYVSVEGVVSSIEPTDAKTLTDMAIRYLGEAQGTAYAAGSDLTGQVTVRVKPERWLAVDYSRT